MSPWLGALRRRGAAARAQPGSSWADALTGAAAMASLGGPLLLTPTGTSTLAPPSADALDTLRPQRVVIFGGTGAVTAGAAGQAAQHLNVGGPQ